ncbi:MAG: sulfatase [Verrucomicrobiota bacterium JB024]|nr:sulfatase [Verrucomicrobiota bacterium JB024]
MLKLAPFLILLGAASLCAQEQKPNILFIAIDDLRNYVGYFPDEHPSARTPNIDRLSAEGVSFTNAYCQSPMCAASRNSLMTGLLPSTTGAYGFQQRREIPSMEVETLPEHFRNNGYTTIGTGKLHHGSTAEGHGPDPEEWDEYWPSIDKPRIASSGSYAKRYHPWANVKWGPTVEGDEAQGDYMHAEWAVKRLEQGLPQPFFLGVGFYRPHLPWKVPQSYFDDFSPSSGLPPVPKKADDLDDVSEAGVFFSRYLHKGRYAVEEVIAKNDWYDEALQAYLACVEFTDKQVGKVLDALAESPYADNTIVVLWTDHGYNLGEKKAWTKFTLWREADRVPLIIVVPHKLAGKICDAPVQLLDLYPTLVSLAGLPEPAHKLEGRDISPLLEDVDAPWPYAALTTAGENNHAVSTSQWRYLRYFNGDEELYKIREDPNEWTNLAGDPVYASVKTELARFLPETNAPNAPGTTLNAYYDRGYWDIDAMTAATLKAVQSTDEEEKEEPTSSR